MINTELTLVQIYTCLMKTQYHKIVTTVAIDKISLQTYMKTCVLACLAFAFQSETINLSMLCWSQTNAVFQNFAKYANMVVLLYMHA